MVRLPRIAVPALLVSRRRWRIVLIEDNDDARQMLSQLLRMEGRAVFEAYGQKKDSEHALAAGFDFHRVKSADLRRLVEVIDLCGQAALSRSVASEHA